MAEKKDIQKSHPSKRDGNFKNKNLAIFVFFLFLSTILWYLNELGKNIEAKINYPANYVNLPKERMIADDQPVSLTLFLRGPGYSILKLKLSRKIIPLNIDIVNTGYKRVSGSKDLNYFILTSNLTKDLTTVIRSDFEIESIKPDTLFFSFIKVSAESDNTIKNK